MPQITNEAQLRTILGAPNPMTKKKVRDGLDSQARAFLERCPFLLLATRNEDGSLEVSPKGDGPGFVRIENSTSILLPERPGNNLAFGLTNIIRNSQVALLCLSPGTGETLRIGGTASLHDDADLCAALEARGKPAKLVMRIAITRVFFHCARSVLRASLWDAKGWPEPMKVSFGKIYAEVADADAQAAERIDHSVNEAYRTML